jgi:hypothetical protein
MAHHHVRDDVCRLLDRKRNPCRSSARRQAFADGRPHHRQPRLSITTIPSALPHCHRTHCSSTRDMADLETSTSLGSNVRSRSYLQEHQQYRPPQPDGHQGIDSIVEGIQASSLDAPKAFSPYNGVPSTKSPPKIVDSGLNHTLSHTSCQPKVGVQTDRLIATLMYKTRNPRATITEIPPDRTPSPSLITQPRACPDALQLSSGAASTRPRTSRPSLWQLHLSSLPDLVSPPDRISTDSAGVGDPDVLPPVP